MKLRPIEQQVVVLFGASSGIGRETALQFARRGARVVVSARGEAGLNSLVAEIRAAGGEATAVPADAADFEQVRAVADRAAELYGGLDTWVHLAAIGVYASFEHTTPEEFHRVIDVNLVGQAYGAMAALPHLKRRGAGALIHVSSVEAERAIPLHSAYAASKHGMKGMLDAMRLEFRHDRLPISVTNIMPASVNTPFFNNARSKLGVQPMSIPPFYAPSLVGKAILYAAEHPVRDVIVGEAGKMMVAGQRLSPRLMDSILRRIAYPLQHTRRPKPADAPDNLYQPLDARDTVDGDYGRLVMPSPATWLQLTPAARWAITGSVLGVLTLLWQRRLRHA